MGQVLRHFPVKWQEKFILTYIYINKSHFSTGFPHSAFQWELQYCLQCRTRLCLIHSVSLWFFID